MSFGKNKSRSTQQQTSTEALDPQIKSALLSNVAQSQARAGAFAPYSGQRVAGFNANQTAAQEGLLSMAGARVGSGLLAQAARAATGASTYRPTAISASPVAARSHVPATTAAARPDVTTAPIGADAIAGYMNPYENEVVRTSLADLERQRQIEQTYNAAQATRAKAFGGTGSAILSSQTNDNYARFAASTSANLRSQGYATALSAAQADAARRLQADQGNQQAGNEMARFNAGQTQSTDQFNAGQAQALDQFNAGQSLEAQRANQQADLGAVGLNLQAADLLSGLSTQQREQALGDLGLVSQVGDAQQAQTQRELDAALQAYDQGLALSERQQAMVNAALAMLGNPTLTQSQGTSSSKSSGFNFDITGLWGKK